MSESKTLDDVCILIVDCVNRTAPEDPNGGYFAVGTPAMRGNRINFLEAKRISKPAFDQWTRRLRPQEGDLLLAREAPIGPVVRIPAGDRVAAGQRTTHLRPHPERIDGRYLFYLLTSPAVQTEIMRQATGSTVSHLRVADVKALALPVLPGLSEQAAIAEVLGALDDKIAANTKLGHSIEEVLGVEAETRWLGQTDSDLVPLSELFDVNPANLRPDSAEPIYIDMKKLPERGSGIASPERRIAKGGTRFMNGDTLMARITPCLENRKTGFVDSLDAGEVGIGSTEFIALRSREPFAKPLSYFVAVDENFRDYAIRHMAGTSGRQRVSAADIRTFQLPEPDKFWIEEFGVRATNQFAFTKSLRDESRTLASLRDTLLPQLMSGKLRVRDAERTLNEVL